jgi:transcriptional regulator with XRE-family HTH domain
MPSNADLGRAVRRLRRARRLTIEDLAHVADMHPTYLSGIERGIRNPTWSKLTAVAEALEVPISIVVHEAVTEAQIAERMRSVRSELGLPP